MKPFVKWAGGKTQLLNEIAKYFPQEYNNYYEPFVGGGAVLFNFRPHNAYINDINSQLINAYEWIKKDPNFIFQSVSLLDVPETSKEGYNWLRDLYNRGIDEPSDGSAVLFIWLNKHCFNGLYRVNSKGRFNVPWNKKKKIKSIDEENIYEINRYLQDVSISNLDFEEFCSNVKENDFVYFDSPYLPESKTADFTSYTKNGFNLEEHKRLASLYKKLNEKGAKLLLSNNNVPLIYSLYEGFSIHPINVKRAINSNGNKRNGKEVLITNY